MTTAKRVFDIVLALLALALIWPVFIVIAVVVLLRDGRPLIFASERMRTPTQAFTLWKFRTMSHDPADSGVTGADKSRRITATGRFLRKTRLDELPQIFNILRGDISFVGPRPPLRLYVDACPEIYREVLKSRPGVTGLATLVYHRHEERILARCSSARETHETYLRRCVPAKAHIDLIYQAHRSVCFDIEILARTFASAFHRR